MKRWMWSLLFVIGLTSLAAVAGAQSHPHAPAAPAPPAVPVVADDDDSDLFAWETDGVALEGDFMHMPPADDGPAPGPMGPWAGGRWGFRRPAVDHMRMRAHMMEMLDLTAEQRARLRDLHERAEKRQIQATADLRIAAVDLRRLIHSDRPDRRAIDAQIDRIAAMRAGMLKARIGTRLEMHSMLTPEQMKKLHEGMGRGLMRERGRDRDEDRDSD